MKKQIIFTNFLNESIKWDPFLRISRVNRKNAKPWRFLLILTIISVYFSFSDKSIVFSQTGSKIYINFNETPTSRAPLPWNNIEGYNAGTTLTNLINDLQQTTSIGLVLVDAWGGSNNVGMPSGIYPGSVTMTYFYIGDNAGHIMKVTGLNTANKYSFTFFCSRNDNGVDNPNRQTQFTINGNSVTLNASNNSNNTVQLTNISPNASGEISITATMVSGSVSGYINAMVIDETVTSTTYTLTLSTPSNGTITASPAGPTYSSGATVTLTANPSAGYQFTGWGGSLSGTTSPTSLIMNANKTVSATFSAVANQAPVASNVTISGNTVVGQQLTGSYTYTDAENNTQGTSTFKWYRADNSSGTNLAQIAGALSIGYTLTTADLNKYIKFEITPVASAGTSPGTAVQSGYVGPITSTATGDNLGNHSLEKNLKLNNFWISNNGDNVGLKVDNVGNVGIGTPIPNGKLHITGTGSQDLLLQNAGIGFSPANSKWADLILARWEDNFLDLANWGTGNAATATAFRISANQTEGKEATLALVRGSGTNLEFLDFYNNGYPDAKQYGIRIQKRGTGAYNDFVFDQYDGTTRNPLMILTKTGNVLIGKTTQTTSEVRFKLDVNGAIRANEIVVNTNGADFVFESSYKLRSLSQVETYIKQHKHLPDIASASEMQTNGASLGDMQTKLLQKVEELTLYAIEKDKQLLEHTRIINAQQKLLLEMKKEIELLKKSKY